MSTQTGQIEVTKTATPTKSKVGDTVTYTINICNTGNTTMERVSVNDTLLGDITNSFQESLASGVCDTVTIDRVVTASDPDPLENTVTANYTTSLTGSDTATVNLFKPSVKITKIGPNYSKVGDKITYTYTIENTSSSDTPNLMLNTVIDTVIGDITQAAILKGASNLAPGGSVTFNADYVVLFSDPNPLKNTVTVTYHPDGYPNEVTASASSSVTLVHPSFTVDKVCTSGQLVAPGTATFNVIIKNTGDIPLVIRAIDQGITYDFDGLEPNTTLTIPISVPVPAGQCGSITNTVEGTVSLPASYGLSNTYPINASATCSITTLGKTAGFWRNKNGNAILDPDNDGYIEAPVTIGGNCRSIFVNTIDLSNRILANNYSDNLGLSDGLKLNTLQVLEAQTLALSYNIIYIQCYNGELVSVLACSNFLDSLPLPSNPTVNDVLIEANKLIANSISGGTTTQAQAGAMNSLLGCLNRETL